MKRAWIVLAMTGCSFDEGVDCSEWHQWGGGPTHAGASCVAAQSFDRTLAVIDFDRFSPQEEADGFGDLVIHYQSPLLDGDDVYMMEKNGLYTPCPPTTCSDLYKLRTQIWTEKRYHWDASGLVEQWAFDTDWKPIPGPFFEPMFQPALVNEGAIAVPMGKGQLAVLNRATGTELFRIDPFAGDDHPDAYVAGGIAVGADGSMYYNVIDVDHDEPFVSKQSLLVAVDPDGHPHTVDYATIITEPVGSAGLCPGTFGSNLQRPLPPAPNPDGSPVLPPVFECGPQRPGVNSTPAIAADGTIYVVSHAAFNERFSFLAALAPDLSIKWTASLRDHLADGCGVLIEADGVDSDPTTWNQCRAGATMGVEPRTNLPPAGMVDDDSSSSPVAVADGVIYGAFTGYNGSRGHLMKFDASGGFVAAYDFGWDTTPAVFGSGGDYKIIIKDNHYGSDANGIDLGPYFITELDSSLNVAWRFQNTETEYCYHDDSGQMQCIDGTHPNGFEWCINAPAVDKNGVIYGNSEDGHIYAIDPSGQLQARYFLDRALGAAYTPLALDDKGRVYALNNGTMTVIGQ